MDLIFDLYHTLLDGADDERDVVVSEMAVVVGVPPEALVTAYHESWRERLVGWSVEETIEILAARLGVSPAAEQIARAAELRRALARRLLARVTQSTLDALDGLRQQGYRLGLVSNATAETPEAWPESPLAGRFEVAVFSATSGLAKPDPAIYRLAAAGLGAEPGGCFFIGDGADDELDGAAAAGMTPIRTTEHRDGLPAWPGRTVSGLDGLLQELGARTESPRERTVWTTTDVGRKRV